MEKKGFRINILDVLIILLVILCIAGAVLRIYVMNSEEKAELRTATVSFLVTDVPYEAQYEFNDGDRVYCAEYGCDIGTLTGSADASNARYHVREGVEYVQNYSAGSNVDIRGQLSCEGVVTEQGCFAVNGNCYIAPNLPLSVSLPGIKTTILITEVKIH